MNDYVNEIAEKLTVDTLAVDAREREGKISKEDADAERERLLFAAQKGEDRFNEIEEQAKQVSEILKKLSGVKEQEAFFEALLNDHRTYQTRLTNAVVWFFRVLARHGTDDRNVEAVTFAREVVKKLGPDDDKYPHYFYGP